MDTNASKKYLESLENKASSVESVMKNLDIMNSWDEKILDLISKIGHNGIQNSRSYDQL